MARAGDASLHEAWAFEMRRLPAAARAGLASALASARRHARERADTAWAARAHDEAARWRIASVYAGHIARSARTAPGERQRRKGTAAGTIETHPSDPIALARHVSDTLSARQRAALGACVAALSGEAVRRRGEDWERAKPANAGYWACVASESARIVALIDC